MVYPSGLSYGTHSCVSILPFREEVNVKRNLRIIKVGGMLNLWIEKMNLEKR